MYIDSLNCVTVCMCSSGCACVWQAGWVGDLSVNWQRAVDVAVGVHVL